MTSSVTITLTKTIKWQSLVWMVVRMMVRMLVIKAVRMVVMILVKKAVRMVVRMW